MPENLQPAVAESAQGGVVGLAGGDLRVVELPGPCGLLQAAEGPLLHSVSEVAVVGQAAGDDVFVAPGAAGDRGLAGVALQRVGRGELLDVFADLTGDPGGERSPRPGMLR